MKKATVYKKGSMAHEKNVWIHSRKGNIFKCSFTNDEDAKTFYFAKYELIFERDPITRIEATHPEIGTINLESNNIEDLDSGDLDLTEVKFTFTLKNGEVRVVKRMVTDEYIREVIKESKK